MSNKVNDMEVKWRVGYKIRECREEMNLTQSELAKLSGVSRTTISSLENGVDKTTTTETLIKIAEALGKSVSEIFF